ncbi:MAG: OmpA family protein [Flavobacteriaceae bacterium]|nr:OmpA family protein [Flavobacteriaceae bacterium]
MKKLFIIIMFSVFATGLGQNTIKRADQLFDKMWYKEAATLYEVAIRKNEPSQELLQKAGDSYFFNTDMKNAHVWYDKLISDYYSEISSEYLFRYSHCLLGIGKKREAKRWMKEFAKRAQNDDRSDNFDQQGLSLEDVLNMEPRFLLRNMRVNTKYSDFGPMYYQDKLVFSSAVDSSNFHTRIYHWNEQPFLNFYIGELNGLESDIDSSEDFSESINTRYHEATIAFSPDESRLWFTRNNYDGDLGRDDDGTNHLKLYSAELRTDEDGNQSWGNIMELPFNSEDYSVGHPAVSSDGKLLYFVSDMPGSIGATDLFVVDIQDDNSYSNPRNLGETINTSGREMFPFITDNNLYFASDGHLGLGGLDVFSSALNGDSFDMAVNLAAPLNSTLDDFGFIIKEDRNTGFVCSNRESGIGDDDIYSFVRLGPAQAKTCDQKIIGYVSNGITGERISDVEMKLLDGQGSDLASTITDITGSYAFDPSLKCTEGYTVTASKTGYVQRNKPVITLSESGATIVPLGMETLDELIVEESGELKIKIGIIYFDLDKDFIRNDAAIELNKVVLLMTQYPNMEIKIESHTDSRNDDDYNMDLSDRRAKSTKEYLISQGIKADRIIDAKGYGESQLINRCSNEVDCSEAEHQLNRRSEFIIIKM